jgi:adenylate cyclase, class 2
MTDRGRHQETEVKLRVGSAAQARRLLRRAGFRVLRRRVFEENLVFDTPGHRLRSRGELLRLRRAGKHVTLTFKGAAAKGKHKSRLEIETGIADFASMEAVICGLGYLPSFRYEKYRTEYQVDLTGGVACLDETPIGVFLELEGAATWIDRWADSLGFEERHYITDSYVRLYEMVTRRRSTLLGDMVFTRPHASRPVCGY